MTEINPVHAPLSAPTYLTHITVPVFRRGRAFGIALAAHAIAMLVLLLIFHHSFFASEPNEAAVALVIEPSPYVGTGQTVITPVIKPAPRPLHTRASPPQTTKTMPSPSNASQSGPQSLAAADTAVLPLPAPPAPSAPAPHPVAIARPSPSPHLGNNQPAGYGLVIGTKIIPARPEARINLPPAYPPAALGHGEQGRVLLSIQVAPSGRATAVLIVSSSGYAILDNAARDAVLGWRFLPADFRGKPIWSTLLLPVTFEIDSSYASVR